MSLAAQRVAPALREVVSGAYSIRVFCCSFNQLRQKIGVVYGNPETATGGNALKFYASVRLDRRCA